MLWGLSFFGVRVMILHFVVKEQEKASKVAVEKLLFGGFLDFFGSKRKRLMPWIVVRVKD